ncbi:MAG: hydrogenase maturation protease [Chloroflexi bacterium]|nr:hydrogenase maturation protease [Chloroflexota bacterium]
MKRLVLGIGNPIIGDDGVGFRVIEALEADPPAGEVALTASDVSGFAILDFIMDYDEVVIVDAIQTVNGRAGDIYRLALDDFRVTKHTPSTHDVDLPTALEIGKILNMKLPGKISIVAIEIPDAYEFSNDLTPPVQAAVPLAAQMVKEILAESRD